MLSKATKLHTTLTNTLLKSDKLHVITETKSSVIIEAKITKKHRPNIDLSHKL